MSIMRQGILSADLDAPVISPTLNLDFANSQELDPRITFSRGSIGTFVNKNGLIETAPANIPRFDYDPVTGECKGLLIEESRSNLMTGSEDFGITYWVRINSVTTSANVVTAPDGTTTADKFIENTLSVGSASHKVIARSFTLSASTTYTFSIFVKAAERTNVMIHLRESNYNVRFGGFFNLATKTFTNETTAGATLVSSSIISLPNDWYRISVSGDIGVNTAAVTTIYLCNSSNNIGYAGDGTSGVYLWGAQLEQGAFPTSYIPTTASTVTRSADLADMTGTNFSSWYNQTESTILCNFNAYNVMSSYYTGVFGIFGPEPSGLNRIEMLLNGVGGGGTTQPIYHNLYQNGPNFANYFGFSYRTGLTKNIMRYKDMDNFVASKDGSIRRNQSTPRAFTIPLTKTMNTLRIGRVNNYLNGAISKFSYYPKALNDAEIQYLTQ